MKNLMNRLIYYSDLIFNLTAKSIKKRYKQKYLKAAWVIIQPVISLIIFTIVFSKVAKIPSEKVPYPLFIFTALAFWNFFAMSINSCTNVFIANAHFIRRLKFPKITLPVSTILGNFLDFSISMILLVFLFLIYRHPISWGTHWFYLIPVFFIQLTLTLGMALILSIGNSFIRDIQNATEFLMYLWLIASPVAYPVQWISRKNIIFYLLNPMAGILDSYRKILLHNQTPDLFYLSLSCVISISIFILGYLLFKKCEPHLADVI
ncbi:MAG: hypothetical protein A3G33_10585 [Omnitrophica bacterium RIFCSPLOWO2_12_FULL_44_17]|uniref:Transport permease protein n=1 Tax=Candidatus Danuiimicrobium aquiferis TaxID=1801832 RepID=A0A1G1KR57_9BACT|nr:MAG: hypothetical protein A3B72_02900 [Omnitrophica bacterium RIFCSPHIGHO2_02_FULL_45_28]OGW89512.1 MAG: hypothetical protein A3E74_07005 [Omnitrophica bacterium RIFCSPHIGHO2_12_FULL_44_12]OGW95416.1 MAG: hypothetical protein A3G33_10585 [Omnitrophica bacterium RIFCSPLOWO2_12_FULL_44_17]OGX03298.1 MAG: hypothetical protein A3J12_07220 [Omnitrophica bacterium RIFCSPLOWO2_02_FULL_44_11]